MHGKAPREITGYKIPAVRQVTEIWILYYAGIHGQVKQDKIAAKSLLNDRLSRRSCIAVVNSSGKVSRRLLMQSYRGCRCA